MSHKLAITGVVALLLSAPGDARAQQPPAQKDITLADFELVMAKLAIPPESFQKVIGDVAPPASSLNAFYRAYLDLIAPPVGPANPAAPFALSDALRRQRSLKTMEYYGLRDPYLGRCLVAVVVDQAPYYAHRFSPYRDQLITPGVDAARTVDRAAVTGPAGVPLAPALDPASPANHFAALQGAEVTLAAAFLDVLKKLQLEHNGNGLYRYLTHRGTDGDPRAVSLVLAILADPDMVIDLNRAVAFLTTNPDRVSRVRYFLLNKLVESIQGDANDLTLAVLARQAVDVSADAAAIRPVALDGLKKIDRLGGVGNFAFLTPLAKGAVDANESAASRAAYADSLARLTALAAKAAKDDKVLRDMGPALTDTITAALQSVAKADARAGERATALAFLVAVRPVVRVTHEVEGVVTALMLAFRDVELYKQRPETRVLVLAVLNVLGTDGNVGGVCQVLEGLLFSCTQAEQNAILETLGYLRGLRE